MNETTWGDLGNGLYKNPVLCADYSDPDVIRVGKDFYMVCSEFHYMGMPVLHSTDLVNWSIIGKVYDRLSMSGCYDDMTGYAKGSWAPAIRYRNGLYYVYFCTPDEGLYMSTAENPAGPWSALHEVKRVAGWEDPCPFWDDDGNAYLGHSTWGAGPIVIHKMSPDGKSLLDNGVIVYVGKIAEGTKIYKRNGYYYLSIPEGGVETGWQTVLRSKNIYGPYERRVVLQTGQTDINGPHQGALIELENGETWFMHFQSLGVLGRVCHLQPVTWEGDWPVIGRSGEPYSIYNKPSTDGNAKISLPQNSDDFRGGKLGLQWQWNHNPVSSHYSLNDGCLRLSALYAECILTAKNTLTQKLMGKCGKVTVGLHLSGLKDGQIAGLAFIGGKEENWIGIEMDGEPRFLAVTGGVSHYGCKVSENLVFLRADIDIDGNTCFSFSTDEENYTGLGGLCRLSHGFWKGTRVALFTYNRLKLEGSMGSAGFTRFEYDILDWAGRKS